MVKKIKSYPAFPNGLPGLKIRFPFWDLIPSFESKNMKGVNRGEILYFQYKSRAEQEKKINSNPMVLFQGVDQNGNIIGANLMFFNMYIDPQTGQKSVHRNQILPVINTMKIMHFNDVYETGQRKPWMTCERRNYGKLFGALHGQLLYQFWRVYDIKKMRNVQNLNPDSALTVLSTTPPKFVKSTLHIQ